MPAGDSNPAQDDVLDSISEEILAEILDELEMPRTGLRTWFAHLEAYCQAHGGQRYYGQLMSLFEECRDLLETEAVDAHQRTRTTRR